MILRHITHSFFIVLGTIALTSCHTSSQDAKIIAVSMRSIGNKVLLALDDSTTRVLPIEIKSSTYVISFEKQVPLQYDAIVPIIKNELTSIGVDQYVVEIKDCQTNAVILSFYIGNQQDSLLPCLGRDTPVNCYKIEVDLSKNTSTITLLLYSFLVIGLCFLLYLIWIKPFIQRRSRPVEMDITVQETMNEDTLISFGKYNFNAHTNQLYYHINLIELTDNESKLLSLMLAEPFQAQTREHLLEEIWGNKGVLVVSRNIDVLVSKLRKKLAKDKAIKISNVHGVGYKLEY